MTCRELDPLVTPFIDGESTAAQRADVLAHLRGCTACNTRVQAELAAKHVLHAHATMARTMGVAPAWRPRVYRLGKPAVPARSGLLAVLIVIGAGLPFALLRPAPVQAVGVISDSYCGMTHRFTARFNVDEHTCTLGCVERGARFVLVTDTEVYVISNQTFPNLSSLANRRVRVEGRMDGAAIAVTSMIAAD